MALDIDGFAVLRSIAAHPSAFADIAGDAAKAARTLATKQIKNKSATLKGLRDVRKALGADAFSLILDGIPDSQVKSLFKKLDKHHPDLEISNAQSHRRQLGALADGSAEPTEKAKAAPKPKRAKKSASKRPEAPELLDFRSAGATRKR